MKNDLKIGDVVNATIKMTVEKVSEDAISTVWFDSNGGLHRTTLTTTDLTSALQLLSVR